MNSKRHQIHRARQSAGQLKKRFGGLVVTALVSASALLQCALQAQSEPVLAQEATFGQFPTQTECEHELAKMLFGKDADIDLALANWLIAADIPQFADMTRDKYFSQLNTLVDSVKREMARRQKIAEARGRNPDDSEVRCGIFCGSVIKLGFEYAEEFRQHNLAPQQEQALHGDCNKVFLAGLLRTHRGSCVSMPLLYLVIGQRLGMPVHLVALGQHYFVRWQEPGYRMNIETTIVDRVAVSSDDSVYLEDEGLTKDQLRGSDLQNLSNREVLGQLFFTRSAYWAMSSENSKSRSWFDLSRAFHLAPDDTAIQKAYHAIFTHYGITSADTVQTLQEKEQNLARLKLAGPAPWQSLFQVQQLPPSAISQLQPAFPAIPTTITAEQTQQISAPAATSRKESK